MKPFIGVPLRYESDKNDVSYSYMYETLRTCIQKIGGDILPIPPVYLEDSYKTSYIDFPELSEEQIKSLNRYLSMCDGIILPGGIKYIPTDRYILDYAIKNKVPVLGICLSMQMMSNYKEKYQHLKEIDDNYLNHNQKQDEIYKHKVKILKDSLLYKIIGEEEIEVNSFHKHCAKENKFYKTVAYSEDGLIEAIEYPSESFNMGVQWHPERMIDYDEPSKKLMNYYMIEVYKYQELKKEKITTS